MEKRPHKLDAAAPLLGAHIDRARSRLLTLTFDMSQEPSRRKWAMAGGSNGYQAAQVRRQHTLVLISSLPGVAGLPPFIFSSTSCDSPSIATL